MQSVNCNNTTLDEESTDHLVQGSTEDRKRQQNRDRVRKYRQRALELKRAGSVRTSESKLQNREWARDVQRKKRQKVVGPDLLTLNNVEEELRDAFEESNRAIINDDEFNVFVSSLRPGNQSNCTPTVHRPALPVVGRAANTRLASDFATERTEHDILVSYYSCHPPQKEELRQYRSDPMTALRMYYETSGLHRFEYGNTRVQNHDELLKEIEAYEVTPADVKRIVSEYKLRMDYANIHLHHCGCCGIMILSDNSPDDKVEGPYLLSLSGLGCVMLTDEEYSNWCKQDEEIRRLYSVFEYNTGQAYHLFPELVVTSCDDGTLCEPFIYACRTCYVAVAQDNDKPKYSIARGYDFGRLWNNTDFLPSLSIVEKCLIGRVRIYADIIKLRVPEDFGDHTCRPGLKGHVIAMRHTGVLQAAEMLPRLSVDDNIVVYFIGDKDRWKTIRSDWRSHPILSKRLGVRPDVIMNWLNVLRVVNPHYHDVPCRISLSEEDRTALLAIPEQILNDAYVTDDAVTIRLERRGVSSTAPTVPDHNSATIPEGRDDVTMVERNERDLDAVLLDDFDSSALPPGTTTQGNVLRAFRNTLQKTTGTAKEAHNTSGEPAGVGNSVPLAIVRNGQLLNEYTENDSLLYGAFPWLFLFGKGIETSGPLSNKYISFILQHFNKEFARDYKLVFQLFNQKNRHTASRLCSARIHSKSNGAENFINLLNSDNFKTNLEEATNNPTSKKSKRFIDKILPNIKVGGTKIAFGPIERQETKHKIHGMLGYFGQPSFFLTITPNDIHAPLCVRLCKRVNDNEETLQTITLMSAEERAWMISQNAVAAAKYFEKVFATTVRLLLGIELSSTQKTTLPLGSREKGALSYIIAFLAIIEAQGRGTLHAHMLIWGALPPFLLQKCSEFDSLATAIGKVIDSTTTAEISKGGYDICSERRRLEKRQYTSLFECPDPNTHMNWAEAFRDCHEATGTSCQIHMHTFTCRKGRSGKYGCRMCMPCPLRHIDTGPIQIVPQVVSPIVDDTQPIPFEFTPRELSRVTEQIVMAEVKANYPLFNPDSRIIVWELRRSYVGTESSYHFYKKNKWIVPYTPALAACLGSNTATLLLGSAEQAKGAVYYVQDYMTKDATAFANVAPLLWEAQKMTIKYPSTAADSGTIERKAIHMLTRMVNNISTKSEVSVTMAAASLLGMPAAVASHQFQFIYIHPAIAFIRKALKTQTEHYIHILADNEHRSNDVHNNILYEDGHDDNNIEDDVTSTMPSDNGAGQLYCVEGKYMSIPHHINYAYRGESLQHLGFQEYICITKVMPIHTKKSYRIEEPDGDLYVDPTNFTNGRFSFDRRHQLHATHIQMIRSSLSVPILTGSPPPQFPPAATGRWQDPTYQKRGCDFAMYYSTLLIPWTIDDMPTFVGALWDYDGFKQWCATAQLPTSSFITRCRYANLNNLALKNTFSSQKRALLAKFRGRTATEWKNRDDLREAREEGGFADNTGQAYDDTQMDADVSGEALMEALTQYAANEQKTQNPTTAAFLAKQREDVKTILTTDFDRASHLRTGVQMDNREDIVSHVTSDEVTFISKSISNNTPFNDDDGYHDDDDDDDDVNEETKRLEPRDMPTLDTSPDSTLGEDQNRAFIHILKYVKDKLEGVESMTQMLLIVHGGPGVGKSTFARALVYRLQTCGQKLVCCAPTGMAASLLIGGKTIHELLSIPINGKKLAPLSSVALLKIKSIFEQCSTLLIDETSMIGPELLYNIDKRLRQIRDCPDKPFGCMPIILVGDFFQLKPCGASAIFDAVMNATPDSRVGTPYDFGCKLISLFKMITFRQQYRSEDPCHTALIERMRQTDNDSPITEEFINFVESKVLQRDDIISDPSWLSAPIVVYSNLERFGLNYMKAQHFAFGNGKPLLRWKRSIPKSSQIGEDFCDLLRNNEPQLIGLFVKGAPAFLLNNLNPLSGLANGSPIVLHSIMFKDDDVSNKIRERLALSQPGDIVDIDEPDTVIVTVPSIDIGTWLKTHKSLSQTEVMIPLVNKMRPKNKINLDKNSNDSNDKISFNSHGLEVAFAITFHKIQGQTTPKIILDLNKRPKSLGSIDYHALYVGMTRVKCGDNIRVLPPHNLDNGFDHLLKLKPSSNLKSWLDTIDTL